MRITDLIINEELLYLLMYKALHSVERRSAFREIYPSSELNSKSSKNQVTTRALFSPED
jgi:hypothetical protein